jgi:uncharacterized protein
MFIVKIFALTLLALVGLFMYLTANVILMRRKYQEPYAHFRQEREFMAAISAQRNFIDYTVMSLLLIYLCVQYYVANWLLILLCLMLLAGRYCHAYGILHAEQQKPMNLRPRQIGMTLTLLVIVLSSLIFLGKVLMH